MTTEAATRNATAADLAGLRRKRPLVHLLTNTPARNFLVNAVLAVGASPATVSDPDEAAQFSAAAGALLVNLGALTVPFAHAMRRATEAAVAARTPWVLDPTAVGTLSLRTGLAHELLALHPGIIKGNASEILALARQDGGALGPDSHAEPTEAIRAARELATRQACVVALTGRTDFITDGTRVVTVTGGHALMAMVTGTGCSLGGVMAALLASSGDPWRAALAGAAAFAAAGGEAGRQARGPGSFAVAFLDQLGRLGQA
jgi:hydroxyethylthiazole kinase